MAEYPRGFDNSHHLTVGNHGDLEPPAYPCERWTIINNPTFSSHFTGHEDRHVLARTISGSSTLIAPYYAFRGRR